MQRFDNSGFNSPFPPEGRGGTIRQVSSQTRMSLERFMCGSMQFPLIKATRLIKEIFEKAQRVVCWLGEQDKDFHAGYPKLCQMTVWYNEVYTRLGGIGVNKYMMDNIADSDLLTYTNGQLDLHAWKALGQFFERSY